MNKGFTLVELILVIVILGIVSVGTVQYLSFGAQIYADSAERDEVVSQARFLLTRLSKELRHAAPGSVRLSCTNQPSDLCIQTQCLEFVPFSSSTIYTNNLPMDTSQSGVMTVVDAKQSPNVNDWANIYALDAADVYDVSQGKRRKIIQVLEGTVNTQPDQWRVEFGFSANSPAKRVYVLPSSGPVSFCLESSKLYRYQNYGYSINQPTPNVSNHTLNNVPGVFLAQFIQNTVSLNPLFRYETASLTRNAMVNIQVEMGFSNSEPVSFNHEIHLPNVP